VIGDPTGIKIRTGAYTDVSATQIDGRIVVGVVDASGVSVNVIRDDLGDYRELATVAGSFIGDTTIMHARGERLAATGGATGMVASTFDAAWSPMTSDVIARSVPNSMTTAAYGNDAMVAWSTPDACHLQRVAADVESVRDTPCTNARLATDYASRAGQLVYETGEKVVLSNIVVSSHDEIANEQVLAENARAPRVVFDGTRYWASYINVRGDLVVGYVADDNTLTSMALEGVSPQANAYELAYVNGAVWVYALDGETGFNATRMCLQRERI
jgi:hypothetical protein